MSYAVKEMFLTLQGEGVHAGRRAVFVRFAGCNLWSGLERDRAKAICQFCDTDFVGMDGEGGGRFHTATDLARAAAEKWAGDKESRFVVLTGGEPMLQVDQALIDSLHAEGFFIAIESNGTLAVPRSIDWICISPKAHSETVQRSGDELKLVWPQEDSDWQDMQGWSFDNFLLQPKDAIADPAASQVHLEQAIAFVQAHPKWRLSLQNHKILGLA
ncbi:MAG: 7-carboxy-7-deazaguanine synthase [Sphingomonadales bacterium]|nr:7-carboxy-7-deazaguanine synthase [Sphingomonadales bacterium]PIX65197.1 MAG: 7-carboxy-7-deazaguanine synthase [Sphingomonadales bacterium CG_4_10_14_3_um_filter_58_15]NCO49217.1 7-carboxy-7-deazaguanine synthase [Sphingomonadales bacterium]NCP00159.1 7-carboxy-7-deazaguanine synthase [Sphingomonadales bacterium]NCP27929.1 7-carboxy-7-deazaguanine synthase [Sphingomonadales bacterium]